MQEEDPSKHDMVAGVIREGEQDSRIRFSLGMTRQGECHRRIGRVLQGCEGVAQMSWCLGTEKGDLVAYRATPHKATRRTPAEKYSK